MNPDDLSRLPEDLAPHYSRFRVSERLLLTGHSHQAWPDVGFAAQQQAWLDAAELVDDKWDRAFAEAGRVARGFARLLDDRQGDITLGANTHELVVRFLSALPLRERPRVVTTDAEFYTLRRQLSRLSEEGVEIVRVPSEPVESVAERVAAAVDRNTAAVAVSCVFFESARIVRGLAAVQRACDAAGALLLVDAYHALNAIPFSLVDEGLESAFVVGGGYKYCQLGEGNCFLRTPPGCGLRPVVTGWFSDFESLGDAPEMAAASSPGGGGPAGGGAATDGAAVVAAGGVDAARRNVTPRVRYGDGAARFAGATYDPTSHYRAAAVFDFFAEKGLTPELLRAVSQHQVGLMVAAFDALDLDPATIARDRSVALSDIGGFLVLRSPEAADISTRLRERGVFTDYRGSTLRLGPAPYLNDGQLGDAVGALGEVVGASPPRSSRSRVPQPERPLLSLAGRSALITGGGRGIGAATALALARCGARVGVAARTRAEVEEVADRLRAEGYEAFAFRCDVSDSDDVQKLAAAAERDLGSVDILVNNAGAAISNPLGRTTLEQWDRMIAVNATGTFLCTRAVLGGMLDRGWGRVVNVASIAGLEGSAYIAAYSAAKHAVVGFTRAVAEEVAGSAVTVNAVCPGWVDTPMTRRAIQSIIDKTGMAESAALAAILESGGQERLLRPDEVAARILALCDADDETNGEALVIDGGGG